MSASRMTFEVRSHQVVIERLEKNRWRVAVDGHHFASFCTESRARAAGRAEARRLEVVTLETAGRR